MITKEKMLEVVNKLNTAMATTNSDFRGNVEFSRMLDRTYMMSFVHTNNGYKNGITFMMIFEHQTEEDLNDLLLLALDAINYNRLIEEEN